MAFQTMSTIYIYIWQLSQTEWKESWYMPAHTWTAKTLGSNTRVCIWRLLDEVWKQEMLINSGNQSQQLANGGGGWKWDDIASGDFAITPECSVKPIQASVKTHPVVCACHCISFTAKGIKMVHWALVNDTHTEILRTSCAGWWLYLFF